jgi:hypothetical protein
MLSTACFERGSAPGGPGAGLGEAMPVDLAETPEAARRPVSGDRSDNDGLGLGHSSRPSQV